MQINVNYITDSIRTPQEKHSVGVINNPVYLCCMEECVHSDSYTNHRSTPCWHSVEFLSTKPGGTQSIYSGLEG